MIGSYTCNCFDAMLNQLTVSSHSVTEAMQLVTSVIGTRVIDNVVLVYGVFIVLVKIPKKMSKHKFKNIITIIITASS